MALLHILGNLPPMRGEICLQILDQMVAKKHFIFSTDIYHPGSIHAPQERLRRGSSHRISLVGPVTRKPYDFKIFLANDDNKKQSSFQASTNRDASAQRGGEGLSTRRFERRGVLTLDS